MNPTVTLFAVALMACGPAKETAPTETSGPEETEETEETETETEAPAAWVRLADGVDQHSLVARSASEVIAAGTSGGGVTLYAVAGGVATPEALDAYRDVSREVDVAVDGAGVRHLLHSRDAGGPGELIYGTDTSGAWLFEVVDRGQGDSGKGGWNALGATDDGYAYLAWESGNYAEGTAGALFSGSWAEADLDVDLTLDDAGTPWIAGRDSSNVRVARRDAKGGFIDVGLVDDLGGNTGFDVAITIVGGQPAVAYATLNGDPTDLRVSVYDGAAWQAEVIASGDGVGVSPALAATPDGTLHLLYGDLEAGAWVYATRPAGGAWSSVEPAELTACVGAPQAESVATLATKDGALWAGAHGGSGWCVGPLAP